MSRFIVQFQSPDVRAQFLDQNGTMTDNEFMIQLNGTRFRPVHDLAMFPVLVIEAIKPGEEIADGTALFNNVEGIKAWEPDMELFLAGLTASEALNINFINTSIYGPFHGDNIAIAIIDGGIDIAHPDLEGCILAQKNFREITHRAKAAKQDLGHGTAIAGIICGSGNSSDGKYTGIARGVKIIDCNVFDGSGKGFLSDVLAALDFAVASQSKIICMPFSSVPGAKRSTIFESLLSYLGTALDIVICAGTGNFGPEESTIGMPGCFECVLTTGSLMPEFKVSTFSGRGNPAMDKPDFCLPGENIISLNVDTSTFKDQVLDENEYYATFSGNSTSTGILASIVAIMLTAVPALKMPEIKQVLRTSCIKIRRFSKISAGNGILNLSIALRHLDRLYAFQKAYLVLTKEMIVLASMLVFFTVAVSMMLASFI